ncbi:GNAT family N-acetyltransferase [Scatolibacter rhodanostii]|uniref:GNAT family N-acetyltransferase n=1 Tax=Scatolibacter rhodanostii TaxID=2014781 RepID=UPI000C08ACE4|nr:GNAT family N-acetyltransferase [Scatolibacter rhodanostii]
MQEQIKVRKAYKFEENEVYEVILFAQEFLKEQGLPQWQNGSGPNLTKIRDDLSKGEGYVLTQADKIHGYTALVKGQDEHYNHISDGNWVGKSDNYISVHRVAIDPNVRGKGFAAILMQEVINEAFEAGYQDIRIDTHPNNKIMQKVILRAGFTYRGKIELGIPNGERNAYQLIIK